MLNTFAYLKVGRSGDESEAWNLTAQEQDEDEMPEANDLSETVFPGVH